MSLAGWSHVGDASAVVFVYDFFEGAIGDASLYGRGSEVVLRGVLFLGGSGVLLFFSCAGE